MSVNKTNRKEELFSSSKKILRTADKVFAKKDVEFLIVGEQSQFSLYTSYDSKNAVCTSNSLLKTVSGLLYFDYGVGKTTNFLAPQAFVEDNWEKLEETLPDGKEQFSSLENALSNGGTLYYKNDADQVKNNVFILSSPDNLSVEMADKLLIKETSFSQGLAVADSLCSIFKYEEVSQ